jgi:lipopolysaccharide/colanic/teichoic acid biosynthesis glycosyltransferase
MEYLPLYSREQKRRHNVRPGLTGLAQIEGRNKVPWERRLALDVVYADNHSLAMDIGIVLRSVGLVLTRQGVEAEGSEMMQPFRGNGFSEPE